MKIREIKVARIGNSRGVRLPATALARYRIGETILMEERSEGILLRPVGPAIPKLTWEETAREMASAGEDWSAWDTIDADGLENAPWHPTPSRQVAETKARYRARRKAGKRT